MSKRKKSAVKNGKATETKKAESMDIGASSNPISLEGMLSDVFGDTEEEMPLRKAQDIMYDAWETTDRNQRIALARKALKICSDCADAYVLLAEDTAGSLSEAMSFYRQGVEAGERSLGRDAFEEDVGHFWGILETRPYLRARAGLAECLWASGRHDEAIQHYLDDYSPGDESEAIFYTEENLKAWKTTPGALNWLLDQTK